MWNLVTSRPPVGRFVALFSDGSGANLFFHADGGDLYDANMEPDSWDDLEGNYSLWAVLPDNFKLWGETCDD